MAALGVLSLRMGMKVPLRIVRVSNLPDLIPAPRTWHYLHALLAFCSLVSLLSDERMAALGGLRAIVEILRGLVPHAIFAILLRKHLLGESTRNDRIALIAYGTLRVILGVSAGWLGSTVSMGIVACVVFMSVRRHLPMKLLLLILPGKEMQIPALPLVCPRQ